MGMANTQGQTVSPQTLEAIKQQPWYFGHITRADCDNILTDKGQDGDFMVRESETNVSSNVAFDLIFSTLNNKCQKYKSSFIIQFYFTGW